MYWTCGNVIRLLGCDVNPKNSLLSTQHLQLCPTRIENFILRFKGLEKFCPHMEHAEFYQPWQTSETVSNLNCVWSTISWNLVPVPNSRFSFPYKNVYSPAGSHLTCTPTKFYSLIFLLQVSWANLFYTDFLHSTYQISYPFSLA
jgi:hypothetical protein